ncbi:MAG: alpha-E domain-containing protein [Acidimicrobiales bacterium]|nr:alpha-E domain-containing protein [Acidimicrobiales bacterium]
MMLARHAEDLYWAGRYLERAQDSARILDVTYHAAVTSPVGDDLRWARTLDVLLSAEDYRARHEEVDGRDVMRMCILDRDAPSSIVRLLADVRQNVHASRELLSSELWEVVNDTWLALHRRDIARDTEQHPAGLLAWVKTQCQAIVGVAVETMPSDETLRFVFLGTQIERAMLTCRLVRCTGVPLLDAGADLGEWLVLLRSCAGAEAYLRAGGAGRDTADVLRFLLFDPDFPRSLRHAIGSCGDHVTDLTGSPDGSRAARLLGRLHAQLQFGDLEEWLDSGLGGELDRLHTQLLQIDGAIATRFFRQLEPLNLQSQTVPAGAHGPRGGDRP